MQLFSPEVVEVRTTCPQCGSYLLPAGEDGKHARCSLNVERKCAFGRLLPSPGWNALVTEFLKQTAPRVDYHVGTKSWWTTDGREVTVGRPCRRLVGTFECPKFVAWRGGQKGGEQKLVTVREINKGAGHGTSRMDHEGANDVQVRDSSGGGLLPDDEQDSA